MNHKLLTHYREEGPKALEAFLAYSPYALFSTNREDGSAIYRISVKLMSDFGEELNGKMISSTNVAHPDTRELFTYYGQDDDVGVSGSRGVSYRYGTPLTGSVDFTVIKVEDWETKAAIYLHHRNIGLAIGATEEALDFLSKFETPTPLIWWEE